MTDRFPQNAAKIPKKTVFKILSCSMKMAKPKHIPHLMRQIIKNY